MKPAVLFCLAVFGVLAGCVTSRLPKPEVAPPPKYLFSDPGDTVAVEIDQRWWELFGDTTLNRMIDRALAGNRTLAMAASAVERARLARKNATAAFFPSVGVSLGAADGYDNYEGHTSLFSAEATASWEIDLFGRLRYASKAAAEELLASQSAQQAVKLALVAEVGIAYYQLVTYRTSYDMTVQTYEARLRSQALIDSMFRYGMRSAVDLEQARALTATAAAIIPQYRNSVVQTMVALDLLLGDPPRLLENRAATVLQGDSLPVYVPAGVPSSLLERRPDVTEAYHAMQAAAANVGIARAERYPSIVLTGQGGLASTVLKGFVSSGSLAWSAAGSIVQPVFAAGTLRRNEQMTRSRYSDAVLSYEQSVLDAMGDVERALAAIAAGNEQRVRLGELLVSTGNTRTLTRELYANGMTDYLQVLDAERTYYDTNVQYIAAQGAQFANLIDLYKALGGGW